MGIIYRILVKKWADWGYFSECGLRRLGWVRDAGASGRGIEILRQSENWWRDLHDDVGTGRVDLYGCFSSPVED